MPPEQTWHSYRRHGEVTAEQRQVGWTWTMSTGEVMRAQPGDWAVIDDGGNERSVAAAVFAATHERVGPGRYRRSGTVRARPAVAGEVIATLEGDVVAKAGDWIIEGSQGEQWPVPEPQFRKTYDGPVDQEHG